MSIEAGWYEDPHDPTQIRYWDGTDWTEERQPAGPEEIIAGVELGEAVGMGSTALVHRGRQPALDRDVAVKIINSDLDDAAKQRFQREQAAMGRLSAHPGIVPVYASGLTTTGQPYLVMPYLPGSLADELLANGPMDPDEACALIAKVCDAVHFAHQQGVLHRDIKPGNILRSPIGDPMITDFGIAQLGADDEFAKADTSLTPLYAAPEVLNVQGATTASDVYSLGATLFTLVHGAPAFSDGERTLAAIHERVNTQPVPHPANPVPPRVWDAISNAMAKDPTERPAGADDFAAMLRRPAAAPTSAIAPPTIMPGAPITYPGAVAEAGSPRASRRGSMRAMWILAAAALVVVAGVVGLVVFSGGDDEAGPTAAVGGDAPGTAADSGAATEPAAGVDGENGASDGGASSGGADDQSGTTDGSAVEPAQTKPALDLIASQAAHVDDAYRITFAGCGVVGSASATPIGGRLLVAGPEVARHGWLVEAADYGDGRAEDVTVLGTTADGLTLLQRARGGEPANAAAEATVGEAVAVIGVASPDSLFPAVQSVVTEAAAGRYVLDPEAPVSPSLVGAPVFDSTEAYIGTVVAVERESLIVSAVIDASPTAAISACAGAVGAPAGGQPFDGESANAFVLAQELATALADADWNRVRELEPDKAGYSDSRFVDGWGVLARSTLIPVRATDVSAGLSWRVLLVAHENDGGQVTRLFCVTWIIDTAAREVDQTGTNSVRLDDRAGWVDPASFLTQAAQEC